MSIDTSVSPRGIARAGLLPRDLALIALFAALIASLGFVAIPVAGLPVPIVLQNLGVLLAGSILGWKRGALAVIAFLALVSAGLPLLSGGRGGIGVWATPSAGYFVGWIIGAAVVGFLASRVKANSKSGFLLLLAANVFGGVLLVWLTGTVVSTFFTGVGLVPTWAASLIFLPGDLAKAVIAALVAQGIQRAYPVPPAGVRRGEEA